MKNVYCVFLALMLSFNIYPQSKKAYTRFNQIDRIDSTNVMIVSTHDYNKTSFGQFGEKSTLLFVDTELDSVTEFSVDKNFEIRKYTVSKTGKYKNERFVIIEVQNKTNNKKWGNYCPVYLFICDLKGQQVQQISPKNVNVKNWSVCGQTN